MDGRTMTVPELIEKHGGYWTGEHKQYTLEDWKYAVNNGDTRMGYWEWVEQMDAEE